MKRDIEEGYQMCGSERRVSNSKIHLWHCIAIPFDLPDHFPVVSTDVLTSLLPA